MKFLRKSVAMISKDQIKDSGMSIVLIFLILYFVLQNDFYIKLSIIALLLNMIWPKVYYPFAIFWFGLSNILGLVVPKILLSIIFFIVVTPIGLFRRLIKIDSLQLKKFKKGKDSVMRSRNHTFSNSDLEKPY